jgi:hypothetical protein
MKYFKNTALPIFIAGVWINISETVRWMLIIESYWVEYYESLNLVFPNNPLNAVIWMTWGFLYSAIIFVLSRKFRPLQTTLIAWLTVFVMLWIVLWNIDILPVKLLWYNIPLSFIETYVAVLICNKVAAMFNTQKSSVFS